ncbi:MAG: nucleotidyltransferase, partial [Proteobacteria bacterium]|nr:nucleotidyltransferase [Pseudomonadota bacterium]
IKLAFAANLVADGQGWLDLMQDRNLLSHVYDEAQFLAALTRIETRYLALFGALEQILLAQP